MRTFGTRRAVQLTSAAVLAAVALAGCGVGQVAETADTVPAVYGAAGQSADGSVLVRDLAVAYNGVQGYPAGGTAPLQVALFNQTEKPVTITITAAPSTEPGVVTARAVGLAGAATAPSATATPSAPAAVTTAPSAATPSGAAPALAPATITIGPLGWTSFRPTDPRPLVVTGLTRPLPPGLSVAIGFTFANGAEPLILNAPVATPLSPAPRGTPNPAEGHE